jgi:hypothetical protein
MEFFMGKSRAFNAGVIFANYELDFDLGIAS